MQKIRDLHVVGDVKVAKLLRKLTNVKVGSSKNTVLNLLLLETEKAYLNAIISSQI